MTRKLDCIVLIDDNEADNYLHELTLKKAGCVERVVSFEKPEEALAELAARRVEPDLIFLDINMPAMNGWEFIEAFKKLPEPVRRPVVVLMLTTSLNPRDRQSAEAEGILGSFCRKPLTVELCDQIMAEHFEGSDSGED